MGCAPSAATPSYYGGTYPVVSPKNEYNMVNSPQAQHQPYYIGRPATQPQPQPGYSGMQHPKYQEQLAHQQQQQQQQQSIAAMQQHQTRPVASVQPRQQDRRVEITEAILRKYVELEARVQKLEAAGVDKSLKLKVEQLVELQQSIKHGQKQLKQAVKRTEKEKADVDNLQASVREFLEDQATYDEQFTKEQEEYLEALNVQEMLETELETMGKRAATLQDEVRDMKEEVDEMYQVYRDQDELLSSIFQSKYGSELENQLELELDSLLDRRERISLAKTRWQNGLLLLRHAYQQLAFSVNRWKELQLINHTQAALRWQYATETRNNLVAAQQNITSAQHYLHTIDFPYCKSEEMNTLSRAVANIYTDMQTAERHTLALKCYTVTYQRCAALIQWFDAVISGTIMKDMEKISQETDAKGRALRQERLRLIKGLCQDNGLGADVIKILDDAERARRPLQQQDDKDEEDADKMAAVPGTVTDAGRGVIPDIETNESSVPAPVINQEQHVVVAPVAAPAPMTQRELAPPPDVNDLFGNIEEIKKQHDDQMEEFHKVQEINKARQSQGLQEKLNARRRRRAKPN